MECALVFTQTVDIQSYNFFFIKTNEPNIKIKINDNQKMNKNGGKIKIHVKKI